MNMRRFAKMAAVLAVIGALALQALPAVAGTCAFKTLVSISCDSGTGCLGGGYSLRLGAGCTAGTVDLQQSVDGTNWSTVATNIATSYTYCPSAGSFYYRLKLNCTPCGQTTYGPTEGPISCP
ncbi:MAG: hypothetical protein U0527_07945 [Candidatus Eisenbacteria bacterium]